jgi:hypothetical protein
MSKKDEARILVALRDGYEVLYRWHGDDRPRFSTDVIQRDGRQRGVAHTSCQRLRDSGLIENEGWSRTHDWGDWSEPYRLTAAGLVAIQDDVMFAPPKVTSPENLEAARHRLKARKIAGALTFNQARIRDRRVKFVGNKSLIDAFASTYRGEIHEAVMVLLAPHLESFADIDGKESLRITEDGIAATARKRRA